MSILTFTLKSINVNSIDTKYDLSLIPNIPNMEKETPEEVTKLIDLSKIKDKNVFFLDDMKNTKKCVISMIDYNSKRSVEMGLYSCFWCRHDFETVPIGCPIKLVFDQVVKKYYSEITKDNYRIKQDINIKEFIEQIDEDTRLTYNKNNFYITDGVFCSFNCIKSYLRDNNLNPLYKDSKMLLSKLYRSFTDGKSINEISYAPSWRTLQNYGGSLTIKEYRESFSNSEYIDHGITKNLQSIIYLFEKRFCI
jgi:hypothetical protein